MGKNTFLAISATTLLAFAVTACTGGGNIEGDTASSDSPGPQSSDPQASPEEGVGTERAMSEPFGPACADVPQKGAGSFAGMAREPVATAASNNPELSTLVEAITRAGLDDTLNDAEDVTVFAPTNEAFEKFPEDERDALMQDKERLTDVVNYHVVEGRHTPQDLENGEFTSLQGDPVTTSGSGEEFTVNDQANVVCGNVRTANATVYVIDAVLTPR
ncbi:fasciclin domain-containing protein [Marinactinospora endophytica]